MIALMLGHRCLLQLSRQDAGSRLDPVAVEKYRPKELILSDEKLLKFHPIVRLCSVEVNQLCVIADLDVVAVFIE